MIIFPAIDLKGGVPVRLYKGDYSTAERVAERQTALETALQFKASGADCLHMVNLDSAKEGDGAENKNIILEIAKKSGLKVNVGGGIRTLDDVEEYLHDGVHRVIIGTAAVKDPSIVKYAVGDFGARVVIGIDADLSTGGKVAVNGWTETSEINYEDFAVLNARLGVKYFVFTDISRDGTLAGVNAEATRLLANKVALYGAKVIASGGVSGIEDIKILRDKHIYAVICGKSLYNGSLDLKEAIIEGRKFNIEAATASISVD